MVRKTGLSCVIRQACFRDFLEGSQGERICSQSTGRQTRKPGRGALKRRKLVWFGPITRYNDAARNSRGIQQTRATVEMLNRKSEGGDQTGQPNPGDMDRGQTSQALAVIVMSRPCLPYDYPIKGLI